MEPKDVSIIQTLASQSGANVENVMATNMSAAVSQPEAGQECPQCMGSGWRNVSEHDRRVMPCECKLARRSRRLLENAGIPRRYELCTLESFKAEADDGKLVYAKEKAQAFVRQYPIDKTGLIFDGTSGSGKTHLAIGIIEGLISEKGVACFFCGFQELLEKIKNSYDPSVQTTSMEVLRPVFESEVVIIDDLGSVVPTGWVRDTVALILNKRYEDSKTTIITTNYPDGPPAKPDGDDNASRARQSNRDQTLGDRIGERMRDRIHEMCRVINLWGVQSYRGKPRAVKR